MAQTERYMRVTEAAKELGVTRWKVRRMISQGVFHPHPALYDQRVVLLPEEEVRRVAEQMRIERGEAALPKTDPQAA